MLQGLKSIPSRIRGQTAKGLIYRPVVALTTCCNRNAILINNAIAKQSCTKFEYRSFSSSGSEPQILEFQAETRKLLDIVTNSIYTDKEVFIRELVSNASDALEKYRYTQVTGQVNANATAGDLEINIITDPKNNTLTIIDNGIGMSREDLVSNLGTIARSGSKQFVQNLASNKNSGDAATPVSASPSSAAADGIIGQFGVGFYSSFMVSDAVEVESVSALRSNNTEDVMIANKWSSDGSGVFSIEAVPVEQATVNLPAQRGSRIVMKLKESCKDYSDASKIKNIIQKYSNFVSFPIKINGEVVNTVSAIWTEDKTSVTEEQYDAFYRFIASAYDKPKYRLHFRTDAPIDLKCLFYVPAFHSEKFGTGRTELGVNLYSRKVLIESRPKDLLPEWLRFIKGAVDSEDLPLSLSREKPQDSGLLRRIKDVLTRKLIKFFSDEMKRNPVAYKEFYIEYHMFLKEGVCQDYQFMDKISKLLLFESSIKSSGEMVSLDDYISRCPPEQKHIYYLIAPNREVALASPYYETFRKHKKEVLLMYNTIDDFVMSNISEFAGRKVMSAETSTINLAEEGGSAVDSNEETTDNKATDASKKSSTTANNPLTESEAVDLCMWLTTTLGSKRVKSVKVTTRLSDSPAIVTDHESGALRRMMKMVEQANAGKSDGNEQLPAQALEVNPSHPLMVSLYQMKDDKQPVAALVAEQLLDNCLMAAGLIEDPRYMIPRLNDLLLATTQHYQKEKVLDNNSSISSDSDVAVDNSSSSKQ